MNDTSHGWLELFTTAPRDAVPSREEALLAAGAVSVTLADARDEPVFEPGPGETPLWDHVTVKGLFDGGRDALEILARLEETCPGVDWHVAGLAERTWEREWMRDFAPMRFGERLWVVPSGMSAPADGELVRLDPGLAFGTGSHPTTALCLRWLDALAANGVLAGARIVDYGCGSGILAIAAVRLGAGTAIAVDNDPQALLATRDNAHANDVSQHVLTCAPDELGARPRGRAADILIANILAGPLISLAGEFGKLVRPGGHMALSGILAGQQAPVLSACRAAGFTMEPPVDQDGWLRLDGRKEEA